MIDNTTLKLDPVALTIMRTVGPERFGLPLNVPISVTQEQFDRILAAATKGGYIVDLN